MSELNELKTIAVPPYVTTEMKRLHLDLVAKAKQFETARFAFNEYIRGTKKILNVPSVPFYAISEDGTYFKEEPTKEN